MGSKTAHDPNVVEAFIEIPTGSRNKYEWDEERKCMRLDRVLYASVHYPTDYGFVPETLAPDGDALDILVLTEDSIYPGCLVETRPIGIMHMRDSGDDDMKIVSVVVSDPRQAEVTDLAHVAASRLREIEHFFSTYKDLEGKKTEITGWDGRDVALKVVQECRDAFSQKQQAGAEPEPRPQDEQTRAEQQTA